MFRVSVHWGNANESHGKMPLCTKGPAMPAFGDNVEQLNSARCGGSVQPLGHSRQLPAPQSTPSYSLRGMKASVITKTYTAMVRAALFVTCPNGKHESKCPSPGERIDKLRCNLTTEHRLAARTDGPKINKLNERPDQKEPIL